MAASQSPTEGLPPSFADMVRGTTAKTCDLIKDPSLHKGEPALHFSDPEVAELSTPLRFALIGKFSSDRPSMEFLRRGFKTIGFKGDFRLGLIDHKHILIRFDLEEDFHRCWLHSSWRFKDHVMRILKWTPDFSVKEEPPVVPVWVSLEQLPLFLYARAPLFSIGRILGNPLKLDAATISLSRPSVARLCVEVDLRHPLPNRIWIGLPKTGFWQPITYEHLPDYCFDCHSLGHVQSDCGQQVPPRDKQVWRVKAQSSETQLAHQAALAPNHASLNHASQSDLPPHPSAYTSGLSSSQKELISVLPNPPCDTVAPPSNASVILDHAQRLHVTVPTVDTHADAPPEAIPVISQAQQLHATVPAVDPHDANPVPSHAQRLHATVPDVDSHASVLLEPISVPFPAEVVQQSATHVHSELHTALLPPADVPSDAILGSSQDAPNAFVSSPAAPTVFPTTSATVDALIDGELCSASSDSHSEPTSQPPVVVVPISIPAPVHLDVVGQTDGPATGCHMASSAVGLPLAISSNLQLTNVQNKWPPALAPDIGYNDSDYYQETQGSDDLGHDDFEDTDDHTYDDITDGSEGTHMQKKKDRRYLKGLTSQPPATKADFADQSRLITKRMTKRGRPPGSRNRTYFDMQRTMSTRATRATSD